MQKIAADKVNIMECDSESTSVTYGVPLTTKFVIQFLYSTFEVDINYLILIFNI